MEFLGLSAFVYSNRPFCLKVAYILEAGAADIWAAAPSAVVLLVILSLSSPVVRCPSTVTGVLQRIE